MRILVTRPEPDASRMAKQLQTLGHETTIEPLMAMPTRRLTMAK